MNCMCKQDNQITVFLQTLIVDTASYLTSFFCLKTKYIAWLRHNKVCLTKWLNVQIQIKGLLECFVCLSIYKLIYSQLMLTDAGEAEKQNPVDQDLLKMLWVVPGKALCPADGNLSTVRLDLWKRRAALTSSSDDRELTKRTWHAWTQSSQFVDSLLMGD